MKKSYLLLILMLCITLMLTSCNSVSSSLDKNDAKITDVPEDYEFTKVISYDSYSKYITYTLIEENLRNVKMSISLVGSGSVTMDSLALMGTEKKTGERIGMAKTTIGCYNPYMGMKGNQSTYIRGYKSYNDVNLTHYYNGKKVSIADKYYMDIPAQEDSIKSFLSSSDDDFITIYDFVNELKEGGMIQDPDTVIKTARANGLTYYKIEFSRSLGYFSMIEDYYFLIVMNGKRFYGLKCKVNMNDTKEAVGAQLIVSIRPIKDSFDVPTEFSGYISYDEYIKNLTNKMMNLYK